MLKRNLASERLREFFAVLLLFVFCLVSAGDVPLRVAITSDTMNMVLIPAGWYEMGSNDRDAYVDERPAHRVYVDTFYIDKYEVTVGEYKVFIDATGHRRTRIGIRSPRIRQQINIRLFV